jgi:hypothetical protein
MKYLPLYFLISFQAIAISNESVLTGKVESPIGCSKKVMIWLSLDKDSYKERLLLMHTEVPVGGTFQFNVRPGSYQIRGSDEAGCEFLSKFTAAKTDLSLLVKMERK